MSITESSTNVTTISSVVERFTANAATFNAASKSGRGSIPATRALLSEAHAICRGTSPLRDVDLATYLSSLARQWPIVASMAIDCMDEDEASLAASTGVSAAKMAAWSAALDQGVREHFAAERTVTLSHESGWTCVLDRSEVFPDDPGNGTPAMVYAPSRKESGTFGCAIGEGMAGDARIPTNVYSWLENMIWLVDLCESMPLEERAAAAA